MSKHKKMNMYTAPRILKFVLSLIFAFQVVTGYAQRAVQVVTTVSPPFSTLLSEYYTGNQGKLSVMLINTDANQPFLQVYLRMSIEGQGVSLQTAPYGNYPTIDLMTGDPVTLSLSDLAPYFSSQNLIGSTGGGQNRLAEGFYQFCFEVYEKNTHRLVGDKQCAQAYLTLSDPPFLTVPEKGKVIAYTNPFNLLFQWTPRHLANPNAVNTEYEFSLVEIWDDAIDPQAAFYTTQPIYTTKTNTTNLYYGPAEPPLLVGKKYAWRVKVILTNSANEQEPFRNEGYTEVFWFKLQGECLPLQKAMVTADPRTNRTTLSWTPDPTNVGSTKVQVRKKGASNWTVIDAPDHQATLTGLAWDTDYEYQLGNRCVITDDIAFGSLQSFRTLHQDTTTCVPSQPAALSNQDPIAMLRMGDTIYASGFRMRLTRVSGANGNFSGEGYLALYVPTTTTEVSIKASFQNIGVNTDKQLISGKIISMYDATAGGIADIDPIFQGGIGVGDVITGNTSATLVNGTINTSVSATVSGSDGGGYTITLTEVDGSQITINASKVPAVVQDNTGKIYTVDKDGKITPVGAAGPRQTALLGGKSPSELNQLTPEKGVVVFKAHADQQYALDLHQEAYNKSIYFSQKYESLNQGAYRVGNKLLVSNSTDKVNVNIQSLASGMNADSVHFITGKGVELYAKKTGATTYEINLLSGPAGDAQELYAVYRDNAAAKASTDTKTEPVTYSLGKLKIATYEPKEFKVNLVPVGSAQIDETKVAQKLNDIYNKIGISWTVNKTKAFPYTGWDDGDETLDVTDAGKNNQYSDEMQKLNAAFRTGGELEEKVPYLFVFDKQPKNGKGTVEGDMLRNRQFGYLFSSSSETSKTAAHELAHGLFHLQHTFDAPYNLKEGDLPDNLMDYRDGEALAKLQWDAIYAPGLVIGVFEKEGDGKMLKDEYYFRPDGIVFQADAFFDLNLIDVSAIKEGKLVNGPIYGFQNTTTNTKYFSVFSADGKFLGYFINGDKNKTRYQPEQDKLVKSAATTIDVNYFNYEGNCVISNYYTKYTTGGFSDYSWPSILGNELATSVYFDPKTAVFKNKSNVCEVADDDTPLAKGTPGKRYFDLYYTSSISDADKAYMIKIGNVINKIGVELCNEFLDQVKTNKALENDFLYTYTSATKVSSAFENLDLQYQKIKTYSNAIDKLKTYRFNDKAELIDFVNANFVTQASPKAFFDGPFNQLPGTRRNELLDLYRGAKDSEIKQRATLDDDFADQEVLLAILRKIPLGQSKIVLDHLYSVNLLSPLISGFTDLSFTGGNNLTQLIEQISYYAMSNYPPDKDAEEVNVYKIEDRYLIFNDNFLWKGRQNAEYIDNLDSRVNIIVQRRNPFDDEVEYRIMAKPYESLLVLFVNDFTTYGGAKFTGGNSYVLPAIYVYLLFHQDTRTKLQSSVKLTFEVAMCAVGVGELTAAIRAANYGKATVAGFDLAIDAADMTFGTIFQEAIKSEDPDFAAKWQGLMYAYSISKFSFASTGSDQLIEEWFSDVYKKCNVIKSSQKTGDVLVGANKIQDFLDKDEFKALRSKYNLSRGVNEAGKYVKFIDDPVKASQFADEIIDINKATEGGGTLLSGTPSSAINTASYYSTVPEQGASIFKTIIKNHMFADGNKRTAVNMFKSFCNKSGITTSLTDAQMMDIANEVAINQLDDVLEISQQLIK